ncbi:MAG: hypothetical protein AAGA54_21625 [Myxococcota bacterium]
MTRFALTSGLLFAFAASAVGCDAPARDDAKASPKAAKVGAEAEATADDGPKFEVRVEAPSKAAPGKETLAKVHVEPRSPWHMNTEFPVALRIDAPSGVELVEAKQRKDDAERFDDDGLVFALPFTPTTKGAKRVTGEVDFAVCGDAACAPETVPVDFIVEVGCDTGSLC